MKTLTVESLIRRVDLFSLKLFLDAVEEGQIGRAATLEYIAPSAATKRIQDLEDAAGLKLLRRTPKGVVPTQAGLIFVRRISEILATLDDICHEIKAFTEGVQGHISIAAPGLLISRLLAIEIAEFKQKFPQIEIDLQQKSNSDSINSLINGEVDLAAFVQPSDIDLSEIETTEWYSDHLSLIVPSNHPLASLPSISLNKLLDEDLVGIGPKTTIMTNLAQAAKQAGREPKIKYSVSTMDAACSMVNAGLGLALLPSRVQFFWKDEQLTAVPVDGKWAEQHYCIGKRAGKISIPAANALIDQVASRATDTD